MGSKSRNTKPCLHYLQTRQRLPSRYTSLLNTALRRVASILASGSAQVPRPNASSGSPTPPPLFFEQSTDHPAELSPRKHRPPIFGSTSGQTTATSMPTLSLTPPHQTRKPSTPPSSCSASVWESTASHPSITQLSPQPLNSLTALESQAVDPQAHTTSSAIKADSPSSTSIHTPPAAPYH